MSYDTTFEGTISIVPSISDDLKKYINKFSHTRRIVRDVHTLIEKFGNKDTFEGNFGTEGEYFVGGIGNFGQDKDESVIDYNRPPVTQPGLWCEWIINDDGQIEWNGTSTFYESADWMRYLIDNFLAPKGYICNGDISAQGEMEDDTWVLHVKDNTVIVEEF